MKKTIRLLIIAAVLLAGCEGSSSSQEDTEPCIEDDSLFGGLFDQCEPSNANDENEEETEPPSIATEKPAPEKTDEPVPEPTTAPPTDVPEEPDRELEPFVFDTSGPFSYMAELTSWEPQPYAGMDYSLPVSWSETANAEVVGGLTRQELDFLSQNGFVVIHSQEESFLEIRESVGDFQGQPYFLTVDSAFHALHLTFDETLKLIEKTSISPEMIGLIKATLNQILDYRSVVAGTSIEDDTDLAAAYLSVALKLFDPEAVIDPAYEDLVNEQIDLIMAGEGKALSPIIPEFEDDYGAYKPVGHYAGDEELEKYFRGMTWLGRVHFGFEEFADETTRAPLIITLALRETTIGNRNAADIWGKIHEVLTFLIGPTDDGGPPEYADLMDEIYGQYATITDLADDSLWEDFFDSRELIPAPQINSTFVDWVSTDLEGERGWRFMGQRFTIDGYIFQNLIFDMVQDKEDGTRRSFPTGLDIMALLGSGPAADTLEELGETLFPDYPEQFAMLQDAVDAQPEEEWLGNFYNSWLYTFFKVLEEKDTSYPSFMHTNAWGFKTLNAALGSWAQLKHDTSLYTKMPEGAGGGGPPSSGPAPGYVEPDPEAFYRLAYAAESLSNGLDERGYATNELYMIYSLSEKFREIGDIAAKELRGEPLDEDDYWIISGCFGVECFGSTSGYYGTEPKKVPIVAAVSGSEGSVLEVAVGYVDRIYVVVSVEGGPYIAKGGVFSYYAFIQPRSNRRGRHS